MNLKYCFSLSFVIILFANTLIGQETFRKGYIIKNNGDSLSGMILYEENQSPPKKIVFKRFEIAETLTLKPSDIKVFGYRNANRYKSLLVNRKPVFLECLIEGRVSLYQQGKKIFAEKDNQLVEIKDKEVTYNNKTYSKAFELLEALTYETDMLNISAYISLSPERLVPLIQEYNELVKSDFYVYFSPEEDEEKSVDLITKEKRHSFGLLSSYNINPASIGTSGLSFITTPINSYDFNDISYGLFYNFKFNTLFHDLSIQVEMHYKKFNGEYYIETIRTPLTRKYYIDIKSSSTDLRVPIALQYTKPFSSFSVFANIGIVNNFRLNSEISGLLEVEDNGEILSYNDLNDSKYKDYRHKRSYFASLGFRIPINRKITLIAESRAEMLFCNLEKDVDFKPNNTEVLEFTYYSPEITLIRKSPVISFMIGIGF